MGGREAEGAGKDGGEERENGLEVHVSAAPFA